VHVECTGLRPWVRLASLLTSRDIPTARRVIAEVSILPRYDAVLGDLVVVRTSHTVLTQPHTVQYSPLHTVLTQTHTVQYSPPHTVLTQPHTVQYSPLHTVLTQPHTVQYSPLHTVLTQTQTVQYSPLHTTLYGVAYCC
jgi:hypothetical protein